MSHSETKGPIAEVILEQDHELVPLTCTKRSLHRLLGLSSPVSAGKALVSGSVLFCGLEDPQQPTSHHMIFSLNASATKIEVIETFKMTEHIRGFCDVGACRIVAASGSSLACLSHKDGKEISTLDSATPHSDWITQVSSNAQQRLASGSFDGTLAVHDIQASLKSPTAFFRLDGTPLALEWVPEQENVLGISIEANSKSQYARCDVRDEKSAHVLYTPSEGGDIFAIHHFDAYTALLGFDDGTIQVIDARSPTKPICAFADGQVAAVGHIDINTDRTRVAVSGEGGFTVWSLSNAQLRRVHSEEGSIEIGPLTAPSKVSSKLTFTHSAYVTTDSDGIIAIWSS